MEFSRQPRGHGKGKKMVRRDANLTSATRTRQTGKRVLTDEIVHPLPGSEHRKCCNSNGVRTLMHKIYGLS
ncbi:MAG: hypothetical protein NVS2B16_34380 [Chloroflexota bacterium]